MIQNYIVINGIQKVELESALENLVKEYTSYEKFGSLKLLEIDSLNDVYAVRFEKEPDFERFSYVVNFLKYPIGPEYKNADVKGYYSLNEELPINSISNERLMLYIPNDDKSYFNVSVKSESNKSFKFDWDSEEHMFKEFESDITFDEPDLDISNRQTLSFYGFQKDENPKAGCLGVLIVLIIGTGLIIKNML